MLDNLKGTRLDAWIKVIVDPFARQRGFSLVGKEFKCMEYSPSEQEVIDSKGVRIVMRSWAVHQQEMFRVAPELFKSAYGQQHGDKPWMFPVEFCETFVRPKNYLTFKVLEHDLLK